MKKVRQAQQKQSTKLHQSRFRQRILPVGFALAAFALVSSFWVFGSSQDVQQRLTVALNEAVKDLGFEVLDISIAGTLHTQKSDVLEQAVIDRQLNIFSQHLEDIRLRVELLPWVKSASVARQLPNGLHIDIIEHRPFALWQNKGQLKLITASGDVVIEAMHDQFPTLPLVVGDGANVEAGALIEVLSQTPELAQRVRAAIRVGARRWDIEFDNAVLLNLPHEGLPQAWRRFADLQKTAGILEQGYRKLDLRLPDVLVVRPETAVPNLKREKGGQAT